MIGIVVQPNRNSVFAYPPPYPGAESPVYSPSPTAPPDEPLKNPTPTMVQKIKLTSITIEIFVSGLEDQDEVKLELMPGIQATSDRVASLGILLPELSPKNGKQMIEAENIPTCTYQIVINAPSKYYREPMG
jgi:hypothetical protein